MNSARGSAKTRPDRINLRREFPISKKASLKASFPFFAGFILITLIGAAIDYFFVSVMEDDLLRNLLQFSIVGIWLSSFLSFIGRYVVHAIETGYYSYHIESGQLVISKGIFLKQRGSFPLARITDIYIDRKPLDLLFGLYDLHVSTPTIHSGEFAHIPGLSKKCAHGLQDLLSSLVEEAGQVESSDRESS